ncbi:MULTISPECIES: DUF1592 domain-containing protein [unclassified Sphingobium]|uniref:DUF1592 domain-containing protein n=2 Tax=unclassified Sphingobium TaxID=2611147 RepID=UPI002224674F|nr:MULTISPECIES: DUF1592 domain-containing protein [unclassified Sphingobium]MCW2396675.1 hypothetical protein [Sphingobium sp. B8D3B]
MSAMAGEAARFGGSRQGAAVILAAGAVYLAALGAAFPVQGDEPTAVAENAPHPMIGKYCMSCHDSEERVAGLSFEGMDFDHTGKNAAIWEKVVRKVSAGAMPPLNSPRPEASELASFLGQLTDRLDSTPAPLPSANLRRLNRTEYANAVRDLIGLEINPADFLPPDAATGGFDNISSVLTTSPALIQGYLNAGLKISSIATGASTLELTRTVYNAPGKLVQTKHLEGLPLGTRGGMRVNHFFPVDGTYEISVRTSTGGFIAGRRAPAPMPAVNLTIDGRRVALGKGDKVRVKLGAGRRTITAALLDEVAGAGVNDIYANYLTKGLVLNVAVNGPFTTQGPGRSAPRATVFSCRPKSWMEEKPCARAILTRLGSLAFRRPLKPMGGEVDAIMKMYDAGRAQGTFEDGVRAGLSYILVDPRFIYRFEQPVAQDKFAISDLDLASRLSFFLWSSIPDQQLLDLAAQNKLSDPAVLDQQVNRMLADPRAEALVDNFATQWLHLRELRSVQRESPAFDDNLRVAFENETKGLVRYVMLQNRPIRDLLDADYTFVNERLAQHYGISGVRGDYFRKVSLPKDSVRRGLLGQGAILTVTSVANRTSPVIRGAWVLENILGVKPPPPPPGVETNLDANAEATSLRQRLAVHRENKVCASCHNMMDPIGLALENYDLVGQWRTRDGAFPVDASGVMSDGTKINGPRDLRNAILARSDAFTHTFIEKLMTFAIGRELTFADMPEVRRIARTSAGNGDRFQTILRGVVTSRQFRMPAGSQKDRLRVSPSQLTWNTSRQPPAMIGRKK